MVPQTLRVAHSCTDSGRAHTKLCAANNLNAALTTNLSYWMMVPQTLVTLDGTACNLVGTSYSAFYNQAVSTLVSGCLIDTCCAAWPSGMCRTPHCMCCTGLA